MQLENNLNTTINNAPHPNYKRVVVAISLFFIVAVIVVVIYQYISGKKAAMVAEQELRAQQQLVRIEEAKAYFSNLPPRSQETIDRDRNASREFFKNLKPSDTPIVDQETKDFFKNNL